jgi:hypothetical protein
MNKWRKAGDEVAFRANQEVWRQFASPSKKFRNWLKLKSRFSPRRTGNLLTRTGQKVGNGFAAAKELGKRLERTIRRTLRGQRKQSATNQVAHQESNQAA